MSIPIFKNKTISEIIDILTSEIINSDDFFKCIGVNHPYYEKSSVKRIVNQELSYRENWTGYQRIYYVTHFARAYKFITNIQYYTQIWDNITIDYFTNNYDLFSTFHCHDEIPQWFSENITFKTYVNILKHSVDKCGVEETIQMYKDTLSQISKLTAKKVSINYNEFRNRLEEFHDYVTDLYLQCEHIPFDLPCEYLPTPAVVGDYSVVQPQTSNVLLKWGMKVGNCVGSYTDKVLNKNCVIFLINRGDNEQYTVEIDSNSISKDKPMTIMQAQSRRGYLDSAEKDTICNVIKKAININQLNGV